MADNPDLAARIWINERFAFGEPAIRGRGLRTELLYLRWLAGETEDEIAEAHEMDVRDVVAAIYFHLGRARTFRALRTLRPDPGAYRRTT